MLRAVLEVVLAYLAVDLATGLYHYATDRGWNFRRQVELFADHHQSNTMQGFDWQPSLAAVPALFVGLWLGWVLLIAAGVFGVLAQVPHYFAHRPTRCWLVRGLQASGLMISPAHHAQHHRGRFDSHFCIFSGLNNWWLDRLLPKGPPS